MASIITGVSGGVDSTCTVLTLLEQGYQVVPVYLCMKDSMAPDDDKRLRRLEEITGQPVLRLDVKERFSRLVENAFVEEYERGRTPNPCVVCNEQVKIRILMEEADARGIHKVATGHYARIIDWHGRPALARGDSAKDQSYMLYRLPSAWLSRLIFPLGELEKSQVREKTVSALGSDYGSGESQDICFLQNRSLRDYLKERLPKEALRCGVMCDCQGRNVGTHEGLALYTEGQRKGLGLSGGPWFVSHKSFSDNRLILSHQEAALQKRIRFEDANWQQPMEQAMPCLVQSRYRSRPQSGRLIELNDHGGMVELDSPCGVTAAGQSLVCYDGSVVLGGGIICESEEKL